jgi:putative SOS response-associated peptidase YedK
VCGRITLSVSPEELRAEFDVPVLPLEYRPRFNIAPSQPVLAILADEAGARRAEMLRWGLVPFWAKDARIGNRMINARAETVAEKPAFRTAFARRRCLLPVDGFYEWRKLPGGKVPMRIHRADGGLFGLAGVWEEWRPRGAPPVRSCAILTTGANPFIAPIHHRMPLIVRTEDRDRWLDEEAAPDDLRDLLAPYAGEDLDAYEVSTMVNSPANDVPECLDPV